MAAHVEGVSHDVVNDFLRQKRLMPRHLWALVIDKIDDRPSAFLIVDDSVHDKRYACFIELVGRGRIPPCSPLQATMSWVIAS